MTFLDKHFKVKDQQINIGSHCVKSFIRETKFYLAFVLNSGGAERNKGK